MHLKDLWNKYFAFLKKVQPEQEFKDFCDGVLEKFQEMEDRFDALESQSGSVAHQLSAVANKQNENSAVQQRDHGAALAALNQHADLVDALVKDVNTLKAAVNTPATAPAAPAAPATPAAPAAPAPAAGTVAARPKAQVSEA